MRLVKKNLMHVFPKGRKEHHPDWPLVIAEFVIPIIGFIWIMYANIKLANPDIIVSGIGVLGGLLFAYAIFVFQLRLSYSSSFSGAAEKFDNPKKIEKSVSLLIDEMFYSILYSSVVALLLTLVVGLASVLEFGYADGHFSVSFSALLIAFVLHLVGCVFDVLTTTVTAYEAFQKEVS